MTISPFAAWMLAQEARALLTRLARVKPFALLEPMLPAAALQPGAQAATERYLVAGRREMRAMVLGFLAWLHGAQAQQASAAEAQRRFTILRLKFNAVLTQFDLFNDVISQRSEHDTGVWLCGLDIVAADALALPGYYEVPPLMCYLDRGVGAAIRRARTRLPGGGESPVAVIRVPRERMVGSGIASSLIHEVGHQASALLDLANSLRPLLQGMQRGGGNAWRLFERWIGEILSDFWSCARLGIAATMGLMGVVSLPRAFMFRLNLDDPHPVPWIRVRLSCAMGQAMYPHPQWARLAALWDAYYPLDGLDSGTRRLFDELLAAMPGFVGLLVDHRPRSLRGRSLKEALGVADRQPAQLAATFRTWRGAPAALYRAPPTLVFAVLGQARANGQITPEEESHLFAKLLTHWALRGALRGATTCAGATADAARMFAVHSRQEPGLTVV
ncbi:hypothetical protein [Variovorax saccharolyticus]|uniref:hypothetical protein n=1 Tax=Variovorax saccharolyticus TaxID=3053516 RepID=UPI002574E9B4|nr:MULTISPECIES: hypothetical protein [unclassified Variovorax]MDM0018910.1 hypothetical protein [Variovorax sp. J22R187]MDM0026607.1 hypothetical protein [Variovorax sp. J31P216]